MNTYIYIYIIDIMDTDAVEGHHRFGYPNSRNLRCPTHRALALLPSHKLWLGLDDGLGEKTKGGWLIIPHLVTSPRLRRNLGELHWV